MSRNEPFPKIDYSIEVKQADDPEFKAAYKEFRDKCEAQHGSKYVGVFVVKMYRDDAGNWKTHHFSDGTATTGGYKIGMNLTFLHLVLSQFASKIDYMLRNMHKFKWTDHPGKD
jgi:hypothetical protein